MLTRQKPDTRQKPRIKYLRANQPPCHRHAHPWCAPQPGPLTISRLAWVGGIRSSQRPQGNDDVVDTDAFFCVLLRHVGEELRPARREKVAALTHEDGRALCKKKPFHRHRSNESFQPPEKNREGCPPELSPASNRRRLSRGHLTGSPLLTSGGPRCQKTLSSVFQNLSPSGSRPTWTSPLPKSTPQPRLQ